MIDSGAATRSVFSAQREDVATYEVTLEFTGRLAGGAPSDPKLIEGWLAKNLGITDEDQLKRWTLEHLAETQGVEPGLATDADVQAALEANASEKKAQVFKKTADGVPYVEPRHLKSMLKEATNIAYPRVENKWGQRPGKAKDFVGKMVGGKDPIDFVAEHVFPEDVPVLVADDISGVELAVGHIKDARTSEKRSTIGYFEYCEQPTLQFTLRVLDDAITAEQWARIWTVAEMNGLGARRSQGCGQFFVTGWERG